MSIKDKVKELNELTADLDNGDELVEYQLDTMIQNIRRQRSLYSKYHGGREPTAARTVELHNPNGEITVMGELMEVGYLANKNEGREYLYVHQFEAPLPVLVFDSKKRLFIAGGGYTVTPAGIERL